ncbi:MAG: tRNA lysidine(34) synthetase TilS [Lachnospiraceae bacterium]|nr:tRNA lysidine(34) synthetase TilS [Lachnospiraceae bacterium]
MTLSEKVYEYIKQNNMIPAGSNVLLGVSGGADSVCLLFLLRELREKLSFSLKAVHVQHGIRGEEALRDADFAKELCERAGVECRVIDVDAPAYARENGLSIEEAARILRYRVFYEQAGDLIAVAHHADDLAETVLFNLIRGSGVAGLGGMREKRGRIIRPLLCTDRAGIEEYLKEKGLTYVTDSTNFDTELSRNAIRAEVIPALKGINRAAVEHINSTAAIMRETEDFLEGETDKAFERALVKDGDRIALSVSALSQEHPLIAKRLIRLCVEKACDSLKDITARHVLDIYALMDKNSGSRVNLPYLVTVRREFDRLVFYTEFTETQSFLPAEGLIIPSEGKLETASFYLECSILEMSDAIDYKKNQRYTKFFDYDKIGDSLRLRTRQSGDRISVKGGSKKLKDVFINDKVPLDDRGSIPLVADGADIVWVIGGRMGEQYKIGENTKKVWRVEYHGRQN